MLKLTVLMIAASAFTQPSLVTVKSYHLSSQQIKAYSIKAMKGSGEAAMRLSDNFFYDRYDSRGMPLYEKALPWALIAAENGNAAAQFRVYQIMRVSKDELKQIRALFWLRRAAEMGYSEAEANLQRCPSINAHPSKGAPCFGPGADK